MNRTSLFKSGVTAVVVLGLIIAQATAAPPRKPGRRPGPKVGAKAGPKRAPKRDPKPGPKPALKPGPKKPLKPVLKPDLKAPLKVVPRPRPRVRPRAGVRLIVPAYVPRVVVHRPRPTLVVSAVTELAVVPTRESVEEEAAAYKVVDVNDEYLATVLIDGQPVPVRMVGVEPPLVAASADDRSGALPDQARHFVRNLLVGEFVYLEHDPALAENDADGNLVAYLYRAPDNLLVNLELIRQGYGLVAEGYSFQYQDEFVWYQQKAQADEKGIWAALAVESQ